MTSTDPYLPLIACAPWCTFGDGHPMCVFAKDQTCWSEPLQVGLSMQPAVRDLTTRALIPAPDSLDVYAGRDADGEQCVNLEPTDGGYLLKLSTDEAQQLVEALQLVLGMASA